MKNIERVADIIIESWNDFKYHYQYGGGKQRFEAEEKKENLDRQRLVETRDCIEIWKRMVKEKSKYTDIGEEMVRETLKLDWSRDARAEFNYENITVTCIYKSNRAKI